MARFFAWREEKQILLPRLRDLDDMSFRAKHSGARNLLLVAALPRCVQGSVDLLVERAEIGDWQCRLREMRRQRSSSNNNKKKEERA